MSFDRAFDLVIGHEGGYVNDPDDPGGETKFGISKRAYPLEDIAALTLGRARELYLNDYWTPIRGDDLPWAAALLVFDFAVNSGAHAAVMALQRAVGAKDDGVLGPRTLAAIAATSAKELVVNMQAERVVLIASLPTFKKYGRGWARRVIRGAIDALT